ncbi:amino acid ABC transporter substrate-binding protein, PAAT family [Aliiroseovarius halocynthiae]|uniref:LysM peptidoglycan-binding domain-containing protein n=1 Tax=Aliiroseovarius halocynthiae TaxID=985055 RepID=A0A545SPD3_9RHOB|nr:transporter substrate-binding domain-containing protein [Aliiroseovarius halocynthiae]TQV66838.1 LysM peptidoglycan-binding domain-containing protein [Aliiroseovarius halocynthiae]SMR82325.1 amino acid ABC transporter substrate-binding protein, PAAT family [Aliiroseovarius halocynthiae]
MRNLFFASGLAIAAMTGSAVAQEACSDYVVKRGDSLREISMRAFGTTDFRKIYNANKQAIGKDPNIIRLGMTLSIPCDDNSVIRIVTANSDAEKMAREMSAELIAAAEARAATAIAEAEARVASAEAAEAEAQKASEAAIAAAKAEATAASEDAVAAAKDEAEAAIAAAKAEREAAMAAAAAEREAAVATAKAEAAAAIEAARAEGAALIREAAAPAASAVDERQILLITGGNYAPFTDENLPNRGLYTKLVETAFLRAAPEQSYKIQFVNDWSSHLDLLMPTLAFDGTFPWSRPNCEEADALSEKDRARCETYNFSNPFYEVVDTFFAQDGSGYEASLSYADFAGARICRPEGWSLTHMNAVGLYEPAITLVRPISPDDCFHAIANGTADIIAIEAHLAVEAIGRLGYEGVIIENPNLAAIKSLNVMTHVDHPDGKTVLEMLNRGLDIMQQSGEWRDIVSTALRHQMDNS